MEFRSALYYPHTKMHSGTLLKHSLLLWDRVEFIAPNEEYRPDYNRRMAPAIELIGSLRHPSEEEKWQAHQDILESITRPDLPKEFFEDDLEYAIQPEKFSSDTWSMLNDLGIVKTLKGAPGDRPPVPEPIGLLLMSILADVCAGQTRARITDRRAAYAKITNLMVAKDGQIGPDVPYEIIVPLTLNIINATTLNLSELIRFRGNERRRRRADIC